MKKTAEELRVRTPIATTTYAVRIGKQKEHDYNILRKLTRTHTHTQMNRTLQNCIKANWNKTILR